MKMLPTSYEIYETDLNGDVIPCMLDEATAEVKVETVFTSESWREFSANVEQAIKSMELENNS